MNKYSIKSDIKFSKLNKYLSILFLFLQLSTYTFASSKDSISTTYRNGKFVSFTRIWVNAPAKVMDQVIDDFLYETKYDLDALLLWGLKGLKLRSEKDEIIVFNFKSTEYDKKNDLIKATGEVIVPNIINFPEIHVNSKMSKKIDANDRVNVKINVLYSDAFLSKTTGDFNMTPFDEKGCFISLETKVKFGWFFNIFITNYSYKHIMEWRFKTLMNNLKVEAEKRVNKG